MNHRNQCQRPLTLSILVVLFAAWCIVGSPSLANDRPQKWDIKGGSKIQWADLNYEVGDDYDGSFGKNRERRLNVLIIKVANRDLCQAFQVWYPPLTEGLIVPVFGSASQIKQIKMEPQKEEPKTFADVELYRGIPVKLEVIKEFSDENQPNDLAIPLDGTLERRQAVPPEIQEFSSPWADARYAFRLKRIIQVQGEAVAEVQSLAFDRKVDGSDRPTRRDGVKILKLRQRETFESLESLLFDENGKAKTLLAPIKFRVTRIVPPDPQRNVLGWIMVRPLVKEWPELPSKDQK